MFFFNCTVKGRSECATYEAIPLWLAYFSKPFFFREHLPPSSCFCGSDGGAWGPTKCFLTVGPQKSSFRHSPGDKHFSQLSSWRGRTGGQGSQESQGRSVPRCPRVRVKTHVVISRQPMEGGGSLTDLGERKASSFWGHCWCFINDKGCKTPLSLQLMLKLNFLQLGWWKSPAIISEMLPVSRWGKKKQLKKLGSLSLHSFPCRKILTCFGSFQNLAPSPFPGGQHSPWGLRLVLHWCGL